MTGQTIFEVLPSEAIFAIPVAVAVTLAVLLVRRIAVKRAEARRDSIVHAYAVDAPVEDVETISRRIETAKSAKDHRALAALYLQLARGYQNLGDEKARMNALTSAAGCGSLYGPHESHAAARMQLADVAYRSGDLTSACEHWHLARGAFQASGQTDEQARVDKLMQDHGCPTEWVLTGF